MITVIKQNLGVVDQAAVVQGESLNPLLEVRHHIPGKATLHHKPKHLKAIKHRLKDFWDLKPHHTQLAQEPAGLSCKAVKFEVL